MSAEAKELGWVRIEGGPREIGRALGLAGRDALHRDLIPTEHWHRVSLPDHAARLARMTANVQARFPAIWAEIDGLAEGLDLPVAQVMVWNSRGDVLASASDGCTSVLLPGETPILAHNEDGLPLFRGASFIAEVRPESAPGFRAFCYPGSIPGHAFAFTDAGLAQTVNNLRFRGVEAEIPRMVLGRAVLGAATAQVATAILRGAPHSGGFHFALAHVADRRIVSLECGAGEVSVCEIRAPAIHANHALHHSRGLGRQIVTQSSADRQARGDALPASGIRNPLTILRDTGGNGLPIRRDAADDPDDENTLATAILRVGQDGIEWSIHDRKSGDPAYSGKCA